MKMLWKLVALIFVLSAAAISAADHAPSTTAPITHPQNKSEGRCALQRKCSIRDEIKTPQFASELFEEGNPPPVPKERVEFAIISMATKVNDAARSFTKANSWSEKAEKKKNELERLKMMEKRAQEERKAEETLGEAMVIARGLVAGVTPDVQEDRIERMLKSVMKLWLSVSVRGELEPFAVDPWKLMNEIDPSKMINEDYEMPKLMKSTAQLIETACSQQMIEIFMEEQLKNAETEELKSFIKQAILTAIEETKAKAAKVTNTLRRMVYKRSKEEIDVQLDTLRKMIGVCESD